MPRKLERTADSPDRHREESEPISLDALASAFAEVMGKQPKSKQQAGDNSRGDVDDGRQSSLLQAAGGNTSRGDSTPQIDSSGVLLDEELAAMEDSGPVTPIGILEAMLFVGDRDGRPLSAAGASELMRGVDASEIGLLVAELNRRYEANGCPYFVEGDAGGYCLSLRRPFHPLRERFLGRIREAKLSQAAIDVLAVVAYQQPLAVEQINAMRGKPCNHVLSQLVHRGLLRIERKKGKNAPSQYFTTDRFLQLFGLQSLGDLPHSEELDRQ